MTKPANFAALETIVADRQAERLRWPEETGRGVLVDTFTASAVVAVHTAANEANRAKFERMVAASRGSFQRVVAFALAR